MRYLYTGLYATYFVVKGATVPDRKASVLVGHHGPRRGIGRAAPQPGGGGGKGWARAAPGDVLTGIEARRARKGWPLSVNSPSPQLPSYLIGVPVTGFASSARKCRHRIHSQERLYMTGSRPARATRVWPATQRCGEEAGGPAAPEARRRRRQLPLNYHFDYNGHPPDFSFRCRRSVCHENALPAVAASGTRWLFFGFGAAPPQ